MNNEGEYKVGDLVSIEQCWEDELGQYHDECAEILAISSDGELKLKWLVENDRVREWLGRFKYSLEDISYKNSSHEK